MTVSLVLRTARSQIEDGLITTILEALGKRFPTAPSVDDLRGAASTGFGDDALRYVGDRRFVYRWWPFSYDFDDNDTVVEPDDIQTGCPGRWLRTASQDETAGYLHHVRLFNDTEHGEAIALERLLADTPSVLVSFQGASHKARSIEPGALYWYEAHFTLLAVSQNTRGGSQEAARRGSLVEGEVSDPGTAAIIGDLKALLAGTNLGIEDVARCELGDERPISIELAARRSLEELDVVVTATLTNGDPPGSSHPLGDPWAFSNQYALATTPAGLRYDPDNHLGSASLQLAPTEGLTGMFGAGTATILGFSTEVPALTHTFSDGRATYRDLLVDGSYLFIETQPGDPAPAVSVNALRVGVTLTEGGGIALDSLLCSAAASFGPPDRVLLPYLDSLRLDPPSPSVPAGTQLQFTASGIFRSGEESDVTALSLWESSDVSVAMVTPQGVVTALVAGTATITASFQTQSDTQDLLVV